MTLTAIERRTSVWSGDGMTSVLHVDQEHPFFFDHPLDHVPGMLLVASLLDLVLADVPAGARLALSLQFPALCELDQRTELAATPGDGGWSLTATQGGRSVCEGTVEVRPDTAPAPVRRPRRAPRPVDAGLVHRARPENVILGEPEHTDGALTVPLLPAQGYLADRGYSVEALVEAGRQLATMLTHTVDGHPLDAQLLWCGFEADLPLALPADAVLALSCRPKPAKGRKLRYAAGLVGADGRPHGTIQITCMAVSAAGYRRFRAAGRAA
jgi:hypothetical protein